MARRVEEKQFAKVKNPELWQRYVDVSQAHKVRGIWVKGHDGHTENEMCDKIAKEEATKIKMG